VFSRLGAGTDNSGNSLQSIFSSFRHLHRCELLRKDTALARAELLKHSSEITMTPHRAPAQRFDVAEGNWDLLGNGWTEGASRLTGAFGWLRGADLPALSGAKGTDDLRPPNSAGFAEFA